VKRQELTKARSKVALFSISSFHNLQERFQNEWLRDRIRGRTVNTEHALLVYSLY